MSYKNILPRSIYCCFGFDDNHSLRDFELPSTKRQVKAFSINVIPQLPPPLGGLLQENATKLKLFLFKSKFLIRKD